MLVSCCKAIDGHVKHPFARRGDESLQNDMARSSAHSLGVWFEYICTSKSVATPHVSQLG